MYPLCVNMQTMADDDSISLGDDAGSEPEQDAGCCTRTVVNCDRNPLACCNCIDSADADVQGCCADRLSCKTGYDHYLFAFFATCAAVCWIYLFVLKCEFMVLNPYIPQSTFEPANPAMAAMALALGCFIVGGSFFVLPACATLFAAVALVTTSAGANYSLIVVNNATQLAGYRVVATNAAPATTTLFLNQQSGFLAFMAAVCCLILVFAIGVLCVVGPHRFGDGGIAEPLSEPPSAYGSATRDADLVYNDCFSSANTVVNWLSLTSRALAFVVLLLVLIGGCFALNVQNDTRAMIFLGTMGDLSLVAFAAGLGVWEPRSLAPKRGATAAYGQRCYDVPFTYGTRVVLSVLALAIDSCVFIKDVYFVNAGFTAAGYTAACNSNAITQGSAVYGWSTAPAIGCASVGATSYTGWTIALATLVVAYLFVAAQIAHATRMLAEYSHMPKRRQSASAADGTRARSRHEGGDSDGRRRGWCSVCFACCC